MGKIKEKLNRQTHNDKKHILWTTNVIMPYPAKQIGQKPSVFGGWLLGLFNTICNNKDYELAVAAVYNGKKFQKFEHSGVIYYLLPSKIDILYQPGLEYYWQKVIDDFQPNLIHLHGTEYAHNLALQNICPNEKYLVSIQGLLKPYSEVYLAGLSKKEIWKNLTIRDIVLGGIQREKRGFKFRSKYEQQILQKSTALTGRTKWDHDEAIKIAGEKPYYKCNETLRESFYQENWAIENIEPHSIYVSQARYPIKGFHLLLDAMPKLIEKYPDLKVYVAGTNILDKSTFKKKLLYSGYAKLLEQRIKKNNLEKHVKFIGTIPEQKVLSYMKKCNVFVQCSSIENSSNSLGEAMLIGMPCIASNVGGTSDLLKDKEEGFLYEFNNQKELTKYISQIFDDNKLAEKIGKNAQKHAKITHDKEKNCQTMLSIYKDIISQK